MNNGRLEEQIARIGQRITGVEHRLTTVEQEVRAGFHDTKQEFAVVRDEFRRHMNIVAERLEVCLQVIVDGLISLRDGGDPTERRLTHVEGRVESPEVRVTALENRPKQ